MAISLLKGLKSEWYEPEKEDISEQPEGEKLSGFLLSPMTGLQYAEILQHVSGEGKLTSDGVRLSLEYGLKDWRNVGAEFSVSAALELLPAKYLIMIGSRIAEISTFDGERQKN